MENGNGRSPILALYDLTDLISGDVRQPNVEYYEGRFEFEGVQRILAGSGFDDLIARTFEYARNCVPFSRVIVDV